MHRGITIVGRSATLQACVWSWRMLLWGSELYQFAFTCSLQSLTSQISNMAENIHPHLQVTIFTNFLAVLLVWFASNPKLPHKKAFCSFMGPDYLSCTYLSPGLPIFTAWIVKLKNDICCHEYLRPCRQEYCLSLLEWEEGDACLEVHGGQITLTLYDVVMEEPTELSNYSKSMGWTVGHVFFYLPTAFWDHLGPKN